MSSEASAPGPQMMSPRNVYVRANFSFTLEGKNFTYVNQNISSFGITGLKWTLFDPRLALGREVKVSVEILAGERPKIEISGTLTSEKTAEAAYLGIKFKHTPTTESVLKRLIGAHGFIPASHVRKYPRIPEEIGIPTMPSRAILSNQGELIVLEIVNISPTGLLLRTENPRSTLIEPSQRLRGQIEPRGDFFMAINFEALVSRVTETTDENAGNTVRFLGIRILNFERGHQEAYLALLRDILLKIKARNP